MSQYKYYLKKPRGEIAKDILLWLTVGGAVAIAATSPFFLTNIIRAYRRSRKYPNKKVSSTFYRLWREGCFEVEKRNKQIYISLTEKGRRRAGRFQINHLRIAKPKKWGGNWYVVMFDVPHEHRLKREALRGFLKRLEFYQLQKSVWVCPYDCRDQVNLLRDFFGFNKKELRLIVTRDIEHDKDLRRVFNL